MPRLRARHLLLVLILVVALWLLFAIRQPSDETAPAPTVDEPLETQADLSLEQVDYTQTREGKRVWRLKALRADYVKKEGALQAEELKVTFFDDNDKPHYTLAAKHGTMDEENHTINVWGQVVIRSPQGWRCEGERFEYSTESGQVTTKMPVRIISKGRSLSGVGMTYDLERGRLEVHSEARALIDGASIRLR